jgi:hypothetical protein
MSYPTQKPKEGRILPMPGVTILTFPDGSQCVVTGLNEVFSDMYDKRKPANLLTARKIAKKVAVTRCIDKSIRHQFRHLLQEEYRKYFDARVYADRTDGAAQYVPEDLGLIGILWKLLFILFPSAHPWPLLTEQKQR